MLRKTKRRGSKEEDRVEMRQKGTPNSTTAKRSHEVLIKEGLLLSQFTVPICDRLKLAIDVSHSNATPKPHPDDKNRSDKNVAF